MNISLAKGKGVKGGKTQSSSLGYGLNSRKESLGGGSGNNAFDDDSDDSDNKNNDAGDDDDHGRGKKSGGDDARRRVNQQIAREQTALRRRAQAALASAKAPSMYDYDGAYESYRPTQDDDGRAGGPSTESDAAGKKKPELKQSRYIGDLLKAAKTRERERDVIYERKVAREQAQEDAQEEFQGKERFVTKAYKRKLEERKQWETEQEEKEREEDANDVTKKSANAAFASFYGNLNKVQRGSDDPKKPKPNDKEEDFDDFDPRKGGSSGGRMGFLSGFDRPEGVADKEGEEIVSTHGGNDSQKATATAEDAEERHETPMTIRQRREKKVAEARIRYMKRRQADLEQQS